MQPKTQRKPRQSKNRQSKKRTTGGGIKTFFKKGVDYFKNFISREYNSEYVDNVIYNNDLNKEYDIVTDYWDDWLTDYELYYLALDEDNINNKKFYDLMIEKMNEYPNIFEDTLKNPEHLDLLKKMIIVPYCYEEENGEDNKIAQLISEDNYHNGKVFIFRVDNNYLYNTNNYALLYIINLIYIEQNKNNTKYIEYFNKKKINNKLSKQQNDHYFESCIKKLKKNNSYEDEIKKDIEYYKTSTAEILKYIKENNENNTKFYNDIIESMKKQPNIFGDETLKNKKFLKILKNMYILENIDEPYEKCTKSQYIKTIEEIDLFLYNLQETGMLFIYGINKKKMNTKTNPALLKIINEVAHEKRTPTITPR
jgi:hypothetical protein